MNTSTDDMPTDSTIRERKSRLERIEEKIAQLERQRKSLLARENVKERKARARRMIQIGAISLHYLNLNDKIEPADFEREIKQRLGT